MEDWRLHDDRVRGSGDAKLHLKVSGEPFPDVIGNGHPTGVQPGCSRLGGLSGRPREDRRIAWIKQQEFRGYSDWAIDLAEFKSKDPDGGGFDSDGGLDGDDLACETSKRSSG